MRIPESKIAEIAAAADIVQVISSYIELKKAGKDYRGVCPFHGDKDPSLFVSPQKNIFHCFGCAVGGSVFNFIMRIENLSFVESVKLLAQRYGVRLDWEDGYPAREDSRERLFKILELGRSYFVQSLNEAPEATNYILERGITSEWIQQLGLGFAPDQWDGLCNRLLALGAPTQEALSAGLIRKKTSGGYYDYFRSRIMIPIRGLNGELVAFGGRIFGEGEPKYLNSPESEIFRKKNILFGLEAAKDSIKKTGFVILVEGYFDQISLRIRGIENVAAPLGTSFTGEHAKLLKRFSERVITIFDGDEAGIRAVKRSMPILLAEGFEPECVILNEDKDPDSAINRIGADGFKRLIDSSCSMIDFFLDQLESQYNFGGISGRNKAIQECVPLLREIADSPERDYLIERFASRIRVKEHQLRQAIKNTGVKHFNQAGPSRKRGSSLFDFPADERNVVRGMILSAGFVEKVQQTGVLSEIENPSLSQLASLITKFSEERGTFDPRMFCLALEDSDLAALVASWLQPTPEEDDLRAEVDGEITINESMERLRFKKILRRKTQVEEMLRRCEPGDQEYNDLARELLNIGRQFRR
ncbi:MAG: DNA primase [Pseudomonadota bacterium]